MLAVFCSAATHLASTLAALPSQHHVLTTGVWSRFKREMLQATCSIAVLPWLSAEPFDRLREFKASHPTRPVVLVTTKDADNARHLRGVAVEEVVWMRDVQRELWGAVRRASFQRPLSELAREVDAATMLPVQLRYALSLACRSDLPVLSVSELATRVNCRRTTLWYHWKRAMPSDRKARLEDFLGWLVLVRAIGLKDRGGPWTSVADGLGIQTRTLTRLARRLTGNTLRELWLDGEAETLARFRGVMMPWAPCEGVRHFAPTLDEMSLLELTAKRDIVSEA